MNVTNATEKQTKFTPGPWSVDLDFDRDGRHGVNSDGRFWKAVATVETNHDGAGEVGREEAEANVHLIAAAPDLYASLREMVAGLLSTASLGLNEDEVSRLRRADAALAKAEGRT